MEKKQLGELGFLFMMFLMLHRCLFFLPLVLCILIMVSACLCCCWLNHKICGRRHQGIVYSGKFLFITSIIVHKLNNWLTWRFYHYWNNKISYLILHSQLSERKLKRSETHFSQCLFLKVADTLKREMLSDTSSCHMMIFANISSVFE